MKNMMKKLISILLIVSILGFLPVSAATPPISGKMESPATPITVEINISHLPALNEAADVSITASSVQDAPNTKIELILPKGASLLSSTSTWEANLTADIPATFSARIMITKNGNWEIKAIAKRVVDQDNIWGDMDIIYLSVNNAIAAAPFAVSNAAAATAAGNISGNIKIINETTTKADVPSPAIAPPSRDVQQESRNINKENINNPGTVTVAGTFGYYTKPGDYRDVSNTYVRAANFLVQLVDRYGNHLAFGYTDGNGHFEIPITNPGSAGIQVRWRTYVKYSPNNYELMTVGPGGSSWTNTYYAYSPVFVLSDGYQDIGYWELPQGDTIEGSFWIKDDMDRAFRSTPNQPGGGIAEWSYTSTDGTYYSYGGHIHLKGEDRISPDTVVHEYGHNVMYNIYGNWFPYNDCPNPHYIQKIGGSNCGWTEGWADFFPLYVNGNPTYTWASGATLNLETPTWGTSVWDNGDRVEGRVAGALWDIYDGVNDGKDQFTDGFSNIWYTIYHQKDDGHANDNTFAQYWSALRLRYYSDYNARAALFQNTIDYNNAPYIPSNPSPPNGATGQPTNPIFLSWSGGDPDGDTVTYTVYLDTSSNPTTLRCQTLTSCPVSGLSYNTLYYWKVVASDGLETTLGTIWSFTTQPPPTRTYTFQTTNNAMPITVDGTSYTSPKTFSWADGTTHSVSVPSVQAIVSGQSQYVFTAWSGMSTSTSPSISINAGASTSGNYNANYKTQYYLTVNTNPSGLTSISGSGWYDSSITATTGTAPGTVGTYTFSTWKVDGGVVSGNPISVLMNAPHTATAVYQPPTTYTVTVTTSGLPSSVSTNVYADGVNQGSIVGGGTKTLTFNVGTTHQISVDSPISGGSGIQYVVTNSPQSVSAAAALTFNYKTQYYLTVNTNPSGLTSISGSGWYDAGTTANTGTAPGAVTSGGTTYNFIKWQVDGSDVGGNPISVTMNAPHTATAVYQAPTTRTYTLQTTNNAMAITVDGTSCSSPCTRSWADGTTHSVSVPSSQTIVSGQSQYVFTAWSGMSISTSTSISITAGASTAGTYNANYKTQYYLTVNTDPSGLTSISGSGWYDQGTVVITGTAPSTVTSGGTTYTFSTWKVDGSTIWGNPISVTMNAPHTATAVYQQQGNNTISITDISSPPAAEQRVPIIINNATGIGSVGLRLSYNASVVRAYSDPTLDKGDFPDFYAPDNSNNASGYITINTYKMGGSLTGNPVVGYVRLRAVGNIGDSSTLNLSDVVLTDESGNDLSYAVHNGTFTIEANDTTPPGVSNPTAINIDTGEAHIPDDTDSDPMWGEKARLNVTVIDDVIFNNMTVTINLSAIGGSPAQPMNNTGGNVWSVATNASAGKWGLYNLTVTATDAYGNINNSVAVSLRVIKNGDVNGNGAVSIGDALLLANNVSYPGSYPVAYRCAADVNGNGVINIGDASRLAGNISFPGNPLYILK